MASNLKIATIINLFEKFNYCAWALIRGESVTLGPVEVAAFAFVIAGAGVFTGWLVLSSSHFFELIRWKKRLAIDAADRIASDPKLLQMLMTELPSWVVYPEYDRVRWVNHMLEALWPNLQRGIISKIQGPVDEALGKVKPVFIKSLGITEFTLGGRPPNIAGVKFTSTPGDEIVLDVNLRWNSETMVKLAIVAMSGLSVSAGVANIQMSGHLRIVFKPLLPVIPGFAAVTMSFLGDPHIEVKVAGAVKVLALVPGLERFLLGMVSSALSKFMVAPHQLTLPVLPGDFQELLPQPRGILQVKVVRAAGLPQVNMMNSRMLSFVPGFSTDPYCKLTVSGQTKDQIEVTEESPATLSPEWATKMTFVIEDLATQSIKVEVFDSDELTQGMTDSLMGVGVCQLGTASITWMPSGADKDMPLGANNPGGQVKQVEVALTKTLLTTGRANKTHYAGTVFLELKYSPLHKSMKEFNNSSIQADGGSKLWAKLKKGARDAGAFERSQALTLEKTQLAQVFLFVKVERAQDLSMVSSFDGQVDPLVSIKIVEPSKVDTVWASSTSTKPDTQNPVWNEEFYVLRSDLSTLSTFSIVFEVFDGDNLMESMLGNAKNEFLGRCTIRMDDVFANQRIRQSYDLTDIHCGRLYLEISVQYY